MNDMVMTEQHQDSAGKLMSYVERLENLLDEIDGLKDSLKDLKAEIKGDGFNVKAVDRVVAFRRNKGAADKEAEFINDVLLYAHVTGTPLDVDVGEERGEPAAAETRAPAAEVAGGGED